MAVDCQRLQAHSTAVAVLRDPVTGAADLQVTARGAGTPLATAKLPPAIDSVSGPTAGVPVTSDFALSGADMVLLFNAAASGMTDTTTQVCVWGRTSGNVYFQGCDTVQIVPAEQKPEATGPAADGAPFGWTTPDPTECRGSRSRTSLVICLKSTNVKGVGRGAEAWIECVWAGPR